MNHHHFLQNIFLKMCLSCRKWESIVWGERPVHRWSTRVAQRNLRTLRGASVSYRTNRKEVSNPEANQLQVSCDLIFIEVDNSYFVIEILILCMFNYLMSFRSWNALKSSWNFTNPLLKRLQSQCSKLEF